MEQKEFCDTVIAPCPVASKDISSVQPWVFRSQGIWERHLNGSGNNRSLLQWWEPGTKSGDKFITHWYIEEVMFIEGSLKDLTLGEEWGQGAYAYRLPGMEHGPYVAGVAGCYMFVKIMESK